MALPIIYERLSALERREVRLTVAANRIAQFAALLGALMQHRDSWHLESETDTFLADIRSILEAE